MENWVVGTKLIILIYCVIRYILEDMTDLPLVLLLILLYICADMLYYIVKSAIISRCFLIAACIILIGSTLYINPLFILLLPVNLAELAGVYTKDFKAVAAVVFIPVMMCKALYVPEYLLLSMLSLIVFMLASRAYSSIKALKTENGHLKEKIDTLYGRLNVGAEYENQVKYLSQLEERNSLAQKIHDRVGHTLAGSLIQLEAASMILEKDHEKAGEIIGNVVDHLKEGMENIRSTLRNIKPAPEQLGINRLKAMLDEFSMMNPIKTSLTYKGRLDIVTHTQWKIITDNVKESLTNALKYASASMLKVDLEVLNKLVRTEVRDNGAGAYSFKKGLGISGMEERTENAGGKLIIDGSSGFSIITLLPVGEVANADKNSYS